MKHFYVGDLLLFKKGFLKGTDEMPPPQPEAVLLCVLWIVLLSGALELEYR